MCMPDDVGGSRWGAFYLRLRSRLLPDGRPRLQRLGPDHRASDPTHFVLHFPDGRDGWHRGVRVRTGAKDAAGNDVERDVTPHEWYRYYTYERRRHPRSAPGR